MTPAPKAVESPSLATIGWAAGLFEGEGTVRQYKNPTRDGYRAFCIVITQKDPWILYRLRDYFGGAVDGTTSKRVCYNWRVHGPRARGFAYTIFPFLSPRRRRQCKAVLSRLRMNQWHQVDVKCLHCGARYRAPQSFHRKFCSQSCYHAWEQGRTKFRKKNIERVEQVLALLAQGEKQRVIARSLGIHQSTVSYINTAHTWRHVARD